jgi:hypothetical protein
MRPVQKPAPPTRLGSESVHDLLMDALGSYCCTCERRLTDDSRAWHAQRRVLVASPAPADDWSELLVLCHNCSAASQAATAPTGSLLLPDRDRTFSVNSTSPFVYALEPVNLVYLDDDGAPDGPLETAERALVKATTPAAQATIDYFALNTHYYDPATSTFRIPRADQLAMVDQRVDLRTEAWTTAKTFGEELRDDPEPSLRRALSTQIRQTIQGGGFWSTWATALWQRVPEPTLIARMLLPPRPPTALTATTGTPPLAGEAGRFPGTRSDWIS